jgi:EAL domain-containing protein (putative c-di-GMP-specific phosphodiesterase class I)
VRLTDAEGKAISPQRFIPIAEAAGLIGDIGEWVAQEACRQYQAWLKENLNVTIAINVSPLQFRQAGFADKIHDLIKSTGLPPGALQIEVTEGAVMESVDEAVEILTKIKQLGVKVALDDFGTGYSSLSRLSTLPLDKLKVDQSFVRQIETDLASRAVTETIIPLGRSLNLEVIGEGVESEQALSYLRAQGCDQGQGYWFSRPLPAHDFATWCQQNQHAEQLNARTLH